MHAVMRNTEAHIRSNGGYHPSRGWWASSDLAMEPMECQKMIGWGALPHCQELWKKAVREWWEKTWRMANASLKQSVTFLLAEWDAWPEMRREVMGLRGSKGNRSWGEQHRKQIFIACIITTLLFWASPQLNPTSTLLKIYYFPYIFVENRPKMSKKKKKKWRQKKKGKNGGDQESNSCFSCFCQTKWNI